MSKFSRVAIAAALLAGTGAIGLAPAFAAKKEEPAKEWQPKASKPVQAAYTTVRAALVAKDIAAAEPAVAALEAVAKTDDEKYLAAASRYTLSQMKLAAIPEASASAGDDQILVAPLDALIANPSTPKKDLPHYLYVRGSLSFNAHNYAEALTFYNRAQELGDTEDANLPLLITRARIQSGDIAGALTSLDAGIKAETAAGRKAPEAWYRLAIAESNAAAGHAGSRRPGRSTTVAATDPNAHRYAVDWSQRYLRAYPTPENWRIVLVNYGFTENAPQFTKAQLTDLFRLRRATKSLDQAGYEEYSHTALENLGLPNEAKAVLDEGRATGKIPAGADAQLATDIATAQRNDIPVATLAKRADTSPDGQVSSQAGDVYFANGEYAKAAEYYRSALQKGLGTSTARNAASPSDVNLHLGIALALSGDKEGARAAFAAVQTAPASEIAGFWAVWLDTPPV